MRKIKSSLLLATLSTLAVAFGSTAANAQVVQLNVPTSSLNVPAMTPVVTARLKYDRNGVDSLLFKQPNPAGYPGVQAISNGGGTATFDFSLKHVAANNAFTWNLTNGATTGSTSLPGGASVSTNFSFDGTTAVRTLGAFNILHIFMVANNANRTASFNNLQFIGGSGLTTSGSLQTSSSISNGVYDQWLVAPTGTNLGLFNWELKGQTTLAVTDSSNPNEGLKFEITGKNLVPEPGSVALLIGMGTAGAGFLIRRVRS